MKGPIWTAGKNIAQSCIGPKWNSLGLPKPYKSTKSRLPDSEVTRGWCFPHLCPIGINNAPPSCQQFRRKAKNQPWISYRLKIPLFDLHVSRLKRHPYNILHTVSGGIGATGEFSADSYFLEIENPTSWQAGPPHVKRAYHMAHLIEGKLFLFGGKQSPTQPIGDTWKLNNDLSEWMKIQSLSQNEVQPEDHVFMSIVYNLAEWWPQTLSLYLEHGK